ncbi:DEAD/DEAH box helicase [Leptospirillum ferriphilum]|uniref:RNA helicase n=1 Tax=Leptospirillum ferriphilum (strain ML-04) TaxID=1048260 RepID=J9Z842_LEPFM|nr:DEAD/DEAH box helicase [Leptospirillum ferriphilum]AFS52276.1 RNA helicase [Leptospirillum ferriphilum ML-04]
MNVFEFRQKIVEDYERFTRSFCQIQATDISEFADNAYGDERFWPDPLIQLNPNFVSDCTVDDLVKKGTLHPLCGSIFRIGKSEKHQGRSLPLYKHQEESLASAHAGKSYVVSTGTGSGKSLAYFIPIIDAILKGRETHSAKKISAVVVYPMNALCNSQMEELEKYLFLGFPPGKEPVTFKRYTGQERGEERRAISENPPDILLTNYMMLEYLMLHHEQEDLAIISALNGLRFLVLDELHTYRGRQGADVAMLVRRVRERFNPNLQMIGTSATMASEGSHRKKTQDVSEVASRLFGVSVTPDHVFSETLKPRTDLSKPVDVEALRCFIKNSNPDNMDYKEMLESPLARWIEEAMGLSRENPEERWVRAKPMSLKSAAQRLSQDIGESVDLCQKTLKTFLLRSFNVVDEEGRPLFAFRLHQFLSGAGTVFTTLEPEGKRYLTLEGQQYVPGEDRSRALFGVVFCRSCGQEYLPIQLISSGNGVQEIRPRELGTKLGEGEDTSIGYFMPDPNLIWNPDNIEEAFPSHWLDPNMTVKVSFRDKIPQRVSVDTLGKLCHNPSEGLSGWIIPGVFRFCLNRSKCEASFEGNVKEHSKLTTLSSEGRSSATSVLVLSSLRYMREETDLPPQAKKILAFTDNRQDAALQAGHFNDLIQTLLIRSGLLGALQISPTRSLLEENLPSSVFPVLGLDPPDFMVNPQAQHLARQEAERTMREVLGYRLMVDLKRGWKINNPNLEQLELVTVEIRSLKECCQDESLWQGTHPLLENLSSEQRMEFAKKVLERMRRELCIKSVLLDPTYQDQLRSRSFHHLKDPWGISTEERLMASRYMKLGTREDSNYFYFSVRSQVGRELRRRYGGGVSQDQFMSVLEGLMKGLAQAGIVVQEGVDQGIGYRINGMALEWKMVSNPSGSYNTFFHDLYLNIATILSSKKRTFHGIEGREHTAQVNHEDREIREERFREATLPVLFCSPTMELGVDIAQLNAVYLRNVPPTPANYAQRSGRSGRSGQPSIVITYCSIQSPHDQYFFRNSEKMVAGVVTPPLLDLSNEELILNHLHSIWLAESGQRLEPTILSNLDGNHPDLPLRSDLRVSMNRDGVFRETMKRSEWILETLKEDLIPEKAPWFSPDWLERVVRGSFSAFDRSFERWRTLFKATKSQMDRSHAIMTNSSASQRERDMARDRYNEANNQMELLRAGSDILNSDFYTYRYLANQSFLPGYNFPRLPLLAYIPGKREGTGRNTFLSRPRFLALSEFGPNSLIYHEGSHYRVNKVILGFRDNEGSAPSATLPMMTARLCPMCGYGHFGEESSLDHCADCGAALSSGRFLTNLYRIENVSSRRQERITSDEEERQRQGFELITTYHYSGSHGLPDTLGEVKDEAGTLLFLKFGHSATVSRLNLGRKKRKTTVWGFMINRRSGQWGKDSDEVSLEDTSKEEDVSSEFVRIVPYVDDRKNILCMTPQSEFLKEFGEIRITTLMYALKRGIESFFQLEEVELAAEPLPSDSDRRQILFYESAEGGAGVLQRVITDTKALQNVARAALDMIHCHPDGIDKDDSLSKECEAGCYRCLLSYYNQLDHPLIDRKDPEVINLLVRLSGATLEIGTQGRTSESQWEELYRMAESTLEKAWLEALRENGFFLPDKAQLYLEEFKTRPDFYYERTQSAIYVDGPHHESPHRTMADNILTEILENAGFTVIRFPKEKELWTGIFKKFPDVFGTGRS